MSLGSNLSFDDIDIDTLGIEGLEVVSLKDAMALPETGASSGYSTCSSCSTCGSTSTCGSCQNCSGGDGGAGGGGGGGGSSAEVPGG